MLISNGKVKPICWSCGKCHSQKDCPRVAETKRALVEAKRTADEVCRWVEMYHARLLA